MRMLARIADFQFLDLCEASSFALSVAFVNNKAENKKADDRKSIATIGLKASLHFYRGVILTFSFNSLACTHHASLECDRTLASQSYIGSSICYSLRFQRLLLVHLRKLL